MPDSNLQLVEHLKQRGVLKTPALVEAFRAVDRRSFVPEEFFFNAYEDHPLPIGHGQTISQPWTVAFMLERLQPQPGNRVLDIGSGSGWTTALLAHVVGAEGFVQGLELIDALVELGQHNLSLWDFPQAAIDKATPGELGQPGQVFDRILVSAGAASQKAIQQLLPQLACNGNLVIPVAGSIWHLHKGEDGVLQSWEHPGFAFVPLL